MRLLWSKEHLILIKGDGRREKKEKAQGQWRKAMKVSNICGFLWPDVGIKNGLENTQHESNREIHRADSRLRPGLSYGWDVFFRSGNRNGCHLYFPECNLLCHIRASQRSSL